MRTLVFGDPFFAGRTIRACGGTWVDLESTQIAPEDTLLIRAGALTRPPAPWKSSSALIAVGATYEDPAWQEYFKKTKKGEPPLSHTFYLSAGAVKKLNRLRLKFSFWDAFKNLDVRSWVEPQLRSWFYPQMRVLQVITSLQVGGAERMCADLAKMPECIGIASWLAAKRTPLRKPDWDLSKIPDSEKLSQLTKLAQSLHIDVLHTHLLPAEVNAALEKLFPLVTTIHNTKQAWPRGYDKLKPGILVGCSRAVTEELGAGSRLAWNGVSMKVTRKKPLTTKKDIRIVAVANFRPQKRLHKLAGVVNALLKLGYRPTLTVVGEAVIERDSSSINAHNKFWRAVRSYRLEKRVTQVKTLEVRKILASHDVMVSISAHEGMSLSQLEALAAGLPVVSTRVGGSDEISRLVNSDAYITLPVNAASKTFAEAIIKVKNLPRRNRLPDALSSASMKKRYLWLYYRALSAGYCSNEIWLVTNNFSMGGAQSSARRLLQEWSLRRPVRAFTLQEQRPSQGSQDLILNGVPVENLPGENPKQRALSLIRKCAGKRPHALFFWNTMAPEKCLLADTLQVPIIDVSPGEMYFTEMNRYLSKPLQELPLRDPKDYGRLLHASVVKFERESARMKDFLGRDVAVIPNGVAGISAAQRNFKAPIIFGTAARIAPHKRLEDLIEVFATLPFPFLIAGRIEPGAEEYAAGLRKKSTPNIRWLGEQRIQEFLPQLDIFVMVSEPAGCPNASLEAMSSGLPLIITDVGGANEQLIHELNGWLVPPRDAEAMRHAVKIACQLPPSTLQVMARASLNHVKNFSMQRMLERYEAVLPRAYLA